MQCFVASPGLSAVLRFRNLGSSTIEHYHLRPAPRAVASVHTCEKPVQAWCVDESRLCQPVGKPPGIFAFAGRTMTHRLDTCCRGSCTLCNAEMESHNKACTHARHRRQGSCSASVSRVTRSRIHKCRSCSQVDPRPRPLHLSAAASCATRL